jgi:hypothetical protein
MLTQLNFLLKRFGGLHAMIDALGNVK